MMWPLRKVEKILTALCGVGKAQENFLQFPLDGSTVGCKTGNRLLSERRAECGREANDQAYSERDVTGSRFQRIVSSQVVGVLQFISVREWGSP